MCHTSLNSKKSSSFFKLYHLLVNFSILFMYRKSLANQGLYKKKLDTNQDTHSIKIGVQLWCERRDLNPYGITTRPSNVRVCRFRHSRIFSSPFLTTNDIISKSRGSVNTFLENILLFSEKNYIVDFRHVDIKAFCRAFRYINRKCNVRFNRNIGYLCAFKYFVGILCGGVA